MEDNINEIPLVFNTRTTPFASRDTDQIVYDKAERRGGLKAKITKQFLKEPELLVIESLQRYTFLNANMIGIILERDIGYPKASIKQILSRMTKGRMITRFRITYTDAFDKEHRSSFIYTLGDNIFNKGNIELLSRTAYSYLAFNQFHIAVNQKYRSNMTGYYCKGRDTIDGSVSFTSEGKRVTLNVVTIRKGIEAAMHTNDVLRNAVKGDRVKGTLLILCESELHALEIERYRKIIDEQKEIRVFYMCDHATAGESMPFENVVRIKNEKEYEIVTIPVDDITIAIKGETEEK